MQNDWTIRDEFIYLSQRWPYLVLAFLIGSLLGWGLARLLPASYEAQTVWYVAVNGDAQPRNPDDYKNWQLLQLEAFLISDPVLADTAARLGVQDIEQLAGQLEARWRNAGQWTLAAEGSSEDQAREVAAAWSQTGLEHLAAAAGHANQMLVLERSLLQTGSELALVQARLAALQQAAAALGTFQSRQADRPGAEPLPDFERWNLLLIAGQALDNDPVAASLLAQIPAANANTSEYEPFIENLQAALIQRELYLRAQEAALQGTYEALAAAWEIEQQGARGLTAFLTVEPLRQGEISVLPQNNPALAALVGGLLGLIALILYRLAVRTR